MHGLVVYPEVAYNNPVRYGKVFTTIRSGSNCVHFYGNRTTKCFWHMIMRIMLMIMQALPIAVEVVVHETTETILHQILEEASMKGFH